MEPWRLSVHPVYGAIYRDGEFVQRGAILGPEYAGQWRCRSPCQRVGQNRARVHAVQRRREGCRPANCAGEFARTARVEYIAVEIWPQART